MWVNKKQKNIHKIKCPFCGNDNLMIVLDFKGGRESRKHVAKCMIKIYKPSIVRKFRKEYTKGCGKVFKINIPQKLERL